MENPNEVISGKTRKKNVIQNSLFRKRNNCECVSFLAEEKYRLITLPGKKPRSLRPSLSLMITTTMMTITAIATSHR